jgi:hypothetical protein
VRLVKKGNARSCPNCTSFNIVVCAIKISQKFFGQRQRRYICSPRTDQLICRPARSPDKAEKILFLVFAVQKKERTAQLTRAAADVEALHFLFRGCGFYFRQAGVSRLDINLLSTWP